MKRSKKEPQPKFVNVPRSAPRLQFAALPWRLNEENRVEVLLVTSRDTRRWVIPKGWPMKGRKPHIVAAIEAQQEAGLHGKVEKIKLGEFEYEKRMKGGGAVDCVVEVYPLHVERQRKKWPEKGQRVTYWFLYGVAAQQVDEPELKDIILAFGKALEG
ncbi:MAG: NUDIX hydrolase [Methylocystis sp.]|uniref:NUDIX hydrolase n=1 Tax=Methylocystis sp. TaxID=1911079 RepID=UPI003DA34118